MTLCSPALGDDAKSSSLWFEFVSQFVIYSSRIIQATRNFREAEYANKYQMKVVLNYRPAPFSFTSNPKRIMGFSSHNRICSSKLLAVPANKCFVSISSVTCQSYLPQNLFRYPFNLLYFWVGFIFNETTQVILV